jgi:GNAT superfamily N-acetyltransferase
MNISIVPFTGTDLVATDETVRLAYNVPDSRKEPLQRYLTLQPDGAFVAKEHGNIVGFAAALDYGAFAYIGLMSVHPARQKQGIGHRLMEQLLSWLEMRNCPTVLLDATPVGFPLYQQFGFSEDDTTVVLRSAQPTLGSQHFYPPFSPLRIRQGSFL